MTPDNPNVTASPKTPGGVSCSGLLAALFNEYVTADEERREIKDRLLTESREYQSAISRMEIAWDKYKSAEDRSAANDQAQRLPKL